MGEQSGPIEKAKIIVIDGGTYRGIKLEAKESIEVQFNPNEYSISLSSNYKPKHSKSKKKKKPKYYEFFPENPRELNVTLFYDTWMQAYFEAVKDNFKDTLDKYEKKYDEKQDVNAVYLNKLMALTFEEETSKKPPEITFSWGSTSFKGYVTSLDISYKRFNRQGEPIRAEVALRMMESVSETIAENSSTSEKSGLTGDEPMGLDELFGE